MELLSVIRVQMEYHGVWNAQRPVVRLQMCERCNNMGLITTSVTGSHHTHSVYRAVPFNFVWQMEPCCFHDRHQGDRCA
jgi:hypothetical protein